jgi:hypothetical protein
MHISHVSPKRRSAIPSLVNAAAARKFPGAGNHRAPGAYHDLSLTAGRGHIAMTSDHASLEQDAMSADPPGGRQVGGDRPSEFTPAGVDGDDPITRTLKRAFDAVAAEPIPDDLMQLLAALDDEAEGAGHD